MCVYHCSAPRKFKLESAWNSARKARRASSTYFPVREPMNANNCSPRNLTKINVKPQAIKQDHTVSHTPITQARRFFIDLCHVRSQAAHTIVQQLGNPAFHIITLAEQPLRTPTEPNPTLPNHLPAAPPPPPPKNWFPAVA
jgi:hypothetical protein